MISYALDTKLASLQLQGQKCKVDIVDDNFDAMQINKMSTSGNPVMYIYYAQF